VQGEGGYVVPPKQFFEELERLARAHGILLIFDEVQCGMGRTGKLWAWEHFGVAPDILTTAKGIASGMPISAAIARAELMDWTPGAHASTFGGNPVAAAAALASLEILEREKVVANAATQGSYFNQRLADLARSSRLIGDVRGIGLMACLELVSDKATRAPLKGSAKEAGLVAREAYKRGAMVRTSGPNIILSPALTIERSQIDVLCDALAGAFKAVEG